MKTLQRHVNWYLEQPWMTKKLFYEDLTKASQLVAWTDVDEQMKDIRYVHLFANGNKQSPHNKGSVVHNAPFKY